MCLAEGRTTAADEVDHIVPLALDGEDVDDNTRNLCVPHHLEVTAEQFNHSARIAATGVTKAGRPSSPDHAWNQARQPSAGGPPARPAPPGGSKVWRPRGRTPL